MQPNLAQVTELRKDPTIAAWVSTYKKSLMKWEDRSDCRACGWPHAKVLLCGSGATFGTVRLGGASYAIDASNVEFMLNFVRSLGPGFHWKNEIFFDVDDNTVVVTHLEKYNNCPQVMKWRIPLLEWRSITEFVERQTGPSSSISISDEPKKGE